jgi:hypothetical protein
MARGSVTVRVTLVARQESLDRAFEIAFGARACLYQRDPGGRMRSEDMHETIGLTRHERPHIRGQIQHGGP